MQFDSGLSRFSHSIEEVVAEIKSEETTKILQIHFLQIIYVCFHMHSPNMLAMHETILHAWPV